MNLPEHVLGKTPLLRTMGCFLLLNFGFLRADERRMEDNTTSSASSELPAGVRSALRANSFRINASSDVMSAVKRWGDEEFQTKWSREITPVFGPDQMIMLHDFFSSAVIWVGGSKDAPSVVAFYNPWADGVLLVKMDARDETFTLTDFAFMSGEGFRGDDLEDPKKSLSLYQLTEPLMVAVSGLYAATDTVFKEVFPPGGGERWIPGDLQKQLAPPSEELSLIRMRMLARMRMYRDYFAPDNRPWVNRMGAFLDVVKSEDPAKLLEALSGDQDREAVENLYALPPELRMNLAPNLFLTSNRGVVAALVNPAMPRWILVLSFGENDPATKDVRLEFLDLELSETLLKLWNEGDRQ